MIIVVSIINGRAWSWDLYVTLEEQINILISKNQAWQILYLKHYVCKVS